MNIQVICIGDELLSGDTINTNLATFSGILADRGLAVAGEQCVPDSREAILGALNHAASFKPAFVVIIGGLGPTQDDLTRPITAEYLHRPLQMNDAMRDRITQYLGERAKRMPPGAIETQAMIPDGAEVLPNDNGTAPGLLMQEGGTAWVLLPGPPREMTPMVLNYLLPKILKKADSHLDVLTLRVLSHPESQVEAVALEAIKDLPHVHFAICLKPDCIMLRFSLAASAESARTLDIIRNNLREGFGSQLIPEDCCSAAEYLGKTLLAQGLTTATAESCTGGGIAHSLTAIPGSSEWFVGGIVTYTNQWKQAHLGVSSETLNAHGAVSEETVQEMLQGLKDRCGVPTGMAVSGLAGPGGGTPDLPVGTVIIGAFSPNGIRVERRHFNGRRDTVRSRAAAACISLLLSLL